MLASWVAVRSHLLLLLSAPFLSTTQVLSIRVVNSQHDVTTTETSLQDCHLCSPGTYRQKPCSRHKTSTCKQCPPSTFSHGGDVTTCQQCSQCPAGFYTSLPCTPERDTQCSPCSEGTFSSLPGWPRCDRCSRCALNQEVVTTCNATSNTKCGKCRPGFYQDPDQVLCRKCGYCYPEFDVSLIRVEQCTLQGGDPMYHCRSDILPPYRPVRRTEPKTSPVTATTMESTTETTTEQFPEAVNTDFFVVIALSVVVFLASIVVFALIVTKSYCMKSYRKPLRYIPNIITVEAPENGKKGEFIRSSGLNSLHHSNDEVAKRLATSSRALEEVLPQKTNVPSSESSGDPRGLSDHRDPLACSSEERTDTTPSPETSDSATMPRSTSHSSPQDSGRPRAATVGSRGEMTRVNARINSFSELSRSRSVKASRPLQRKDLEAAADDSTEDEDDDAANDDARGRKLLIARTGSKKSAVSYDNVSEVQHTFPGGGKNFSSSPALSATVSISNENDGKGGARVWINRKVSGLFAGKGSGTSLIQMAYNKTGQIYL